MSQRNVSDSSGTAPAGVAPVKPPSDPESPEYWTTDEVAMYFRQPESTIRFWRMQSFGPRGQRVGRRVLYPRSEILRFEKELAQQSVA